MKLNIWFSFHMHATCKILLLLLSIFSTLSSFSQTVDTQWGLTQKKQKRTAVISDIVDSNEKGVFAIMENDPGYFRRSGLSFSKFLPPTLQHYNPKMELLKEVPLQDKVGNQLLNFKFAQSMNRKVYVFSNMPNSQAKRNFLFVQAVDMETMQTLGKAKKIAESSLRNRRNFGEYNQVLSRDQSKFMIANSEAFEKGENEKFTLRVFDDNMSLLWEKNITIPYSDKLFEVENYR
ncbi:MAG: hypothetical protein AAGI07_13370, partial [Bacteroidota bacterium]